MLVVERGHTPATVLPWVTQSPPQADDLSPDRADAPIEPWRVSSLELSLATASLDELETTGRALPSEVRTALFAAHPEIEELGFVRTCHRVELYIVDREGDPQRWKARLPGPLDRWKDWVGERAVQHLHRVAAGLESLAAGEREVRDQIARAQGSILSRHPRPVLAELFRSAVATARALDANFSTRRSIASIASARVLETVAKPFPRIVVLGAGVVGRQVAESLAPYARLTLIYRTHPPAHEFLRATGVRIAPFEDLAEELRPADAVIAAAKSGERVLGPEHLIPRDTPLVVIDLGLPRNVDPSVRRLPSLTLIDLEGLYASSARSVPLPAWELQVAASARTTWEKLHPWLFQPWIDRLMREAEAVRQQQVEGARPYLGDLTADQRQAVDHLTRRLTAQLLLAPIERLRALPSDPEAQLERETAVRLFARRTPAGP